MKANELMIGDWVYMGENDIPRSITDIGRFDLISSYGISCYVDNIHPVPITPEILEKNLGVVERNSDGYNLVINRELILAFHLKATLDFWIAQPRDWPHLTYSLPLPRYVHELQHALRICGIEKEIML